MLDKSPEIILDNNFIHIQNEFEQKTPSMVLCLESFHKTEFIKKLTDFVKTSVIFVDMDLLFTGYIKAGIIEKNDNTIIFYPNKEDWEEKLSEIITKISKEKTLVVIDSFNMVYNVFDDLEAARFIKSCIMLLSSIGRQTRSSVVLTATARKKENDEWILSPGGKQVIKSKKTGLYLLKKIKNYLEIRTLDTNSKIFRIE